LNSILPQDFSQLEEMPKYLKNRIFGQDHIIDSIMDMLTINIAGLSDDNKPMGTFLFTGPTGVGKTELAIEISKYLGMHFERFDMSEYADDSSYRNLIGGHKGLVGYDDGGLLTNAITEHPFSVLLLDEIEKADKAIYNTFLQVFDYATLKDTKGNVTDFSNTIIIMTSNLEVTEKRGIGFGENKNVHIHSEVVDFLTPEFRNRIDKILHFNTLTEDMIEPVVDKFLDGLSMKLSSRNITLHISDPARGHLTYIGFESAMGARSVKRMINNEFKKNISKEILFGTLKQGGEITIDIEEKEFIYKYLPLTESEIQSELFKNQIIYNFETAEEAHTYAKHHPGTVIARAASGVGYVIK
jgi:ATP-dependent Clp protease ATP-binding subunit ClpA